MAVGNLLYSIDPSKGETPQTIAQRRQMSNLIAARMLGTAPKNVGEGLNTIGQALIARSMMGDADAAQKAGEASLPDFIKAQITGQLAAPPVATPPAVAAAPMGSTTIPVSPADTGPVVPNDSNAMPGTVGMNLALADRSQDFIQDNPGTAMSSGVRSTADQQRLYDNRANNPNPVARPGTSNHERGLAIDIGGMTPDQRAMLPQYGLAQPVANDPPHVELAKATDAYSPLDTAQWPAGPVGAPGTQVAQAAPPVENDGSELPPNAQPTGGALPTAQAVQQASQPRSQNYGGPFANVSTQDLTKAAFNPWLKASNPAAAQAITAEITRRATMDQQASDPMRALDMQTKQLAIQKAQQDASKSDWEWKPYGRDANGNWTYAWVNSKTQAIKGRDGQPIPTTPKPAEDPAEGLMGEDYLKAIPRDRADIARKVANGEVDVSSLPNRGNYRMQVLSDAARFDPTFNPIDYKTRLATRKDFTSGKSAQNITSFNTAIGHLDSLDKSIDKLGNRGSSWYNAATAPISGQVDQKYQIALKDFNTSKQAVIDELTRAFRGSGGNVYDLMEWEKSINATESPAALHAATRRAIELLRSRIEAVGDQYNRGMGKKTDPISLLSPKARATMERLEGLGNEQTAEQPQRKTSSGVSWSIQ